jgi:sugar O-acyltransferase (sialic acid O-acetyltransferase NeuD family)
MSKTKPSRVLVVGLGAQAKYILEAFSYRPELEVAGLLDLETPAGPSEALGHQVLGGLGDLEAKLADHVDGAIVGCADSREKARIFARIRAVGIPLVSAIHPRAVIARSASVGEGVIINACAVIQPFAQVSEGAMIHASVVVEHDNMIGEFANLAPGAKLAGWVRVGAHARVLTGAAVIPKVEIGAGATVGAGAVVLDSVTAGATVVGVPARTLADEPSGGQGG